MAEQRFSFKLDRTGLCNHTNDCFRCVLDYVFPSIFVPFGMFSIEIVGICKYLFIIELYSLLTSLNRREDDLNREYSHNEKIAFEIL